MSVCSTCGSDWPPNSMAAICVQLTGECLWCHFGPTRHGAGTEDELAAVRAEYRRRKATIEYVTTAVLG